MKLALVFCTIVAVGVIATGSAVRAADVAAEAPAAEASAGGPLSWLQMPKVTMPSIAMPKVLKNPLDPFKAGAKKVSDGTKKAWEGTKEIFKGGDKSDESNLSHTSEKQPSMWSRMFGGEEKKATHEPATVAEFMAQPRPE